MDRRKCGRGKKIEPVVRGIFVEEIPDEDLYEDGELNRKQVEQKIIDGWYKGSIILMRERTTDGK